MRKTINGGVVLIAIFVDCDGVLDIEFVEGDGNELDVDDKKYTLLCGKSL